MSDDARRILEMLSEGAISVDEAERLLAALAGAPGPVVETPDRPRDREPLPRYLHIVGLAGGAGAEEGFRLRIPLGLLRAGISMRGFVPEEAREQISEKLREKGIEADLFQLPEDRIDEFILALADLEFEAGDKEGGLRIYLE
ncbi:MAG: hypothetical protein OEN55_05775 [Alphaproteobacteria bacterium]|nr:hypothetical protein [Alphaproteobacteria bacterium]